MGLMDEAARVALGARYNGEKLVLEARRLGRLAVTDGLAFPAGFLDAMATKTVEVERLRQDQSLAKVDVPGGTAGQAVAFAELKDWLGDVLEAADSAFEGDPETRDRFHHGKVRIGRSVQRLLDRASTLVPVLADPSVRAALTEWGVDDAKLEQGRTRIAALREADVSQETSLHALPRATADFYRAKGDLYLDLKRVSRRGRHQLRKDAAKASAYRLDLVSGARPKPKTPPAE